MRSGLQPILVKGEQQAQPRRFLPSPPEQAELPLLQSDGTIEFFTTPWSPAISGSPAPYLGAGQTSWVTAKLPSSPSNHWLWSGQQLTVSAPGSNETFKPLPEGKGLEKKRKEKRKKINLRRKTTDSRVQRTTHEKKRERVQKLQARKWIRRGLEGDTKQSTPKSTHHSSKLSRGAVATTQECSAQGGERTRCGHRPTATKVPHAASSAWWHV